MNKKQRQSLIIEIIENESINNQEGLKLRLENEGLDVSQSSLSRDLAELGAQRMRKPDGSFAYVIPDERPAATNLTEFTRRFQNSVNGLKKAGQLIMVFTPPGEAQFIGRLLDEFKPDGLIGTLAGDDAVLCVTENATKAAKMEKNLKRILNA